MSIRVNIYIHTYLHLVIVNAADDTIDDASWGKKSNNGFEYLKTHRLSISFKVEVQSKLKKKAMRFFLYIFEKILVFENILLFITFYITIFYCIPTYLGWRLPAKSSSKLFLAFLW